MARSDKTSLVILLACLFASSCKTSLSPEPAKGTEFPKAVAKAVGYLSEWLDVPESEIQIVGFEQVEWPDACLGLAGPDEICAQVITPGLRVTLDVRGSRYMLHTDEQGKNIRIEE